MAYSWEQVMLGIDVKREEKAKQAELDRIQKERAKEAGLSSAWGLGLSLLGGAIAGPVGSFIGKQIATYGVDAQYNWEDKEVSEGKFYTADTKKINKEIRRQAKDQDTAQLIGTVMDLGTMYTQAGGLEEGFDPTIGGGDWTSYGTGDDAWSFLGRGHEGGVDVTHMTDTELFNLPTGVKVDPATGLTRQSGDYVKGIFEGGGTPIWKKGGLNQLWSNLNELYTHAKPLIGQTATSELLGGIE